MPCSIQLRASLGSISLLLLTRTDDDHLRLGCYSSVSHDPIGCNAGHDGLSVDGSAV